LLLRNDRGRVKVLETERLILRRLTVGDAPFILGLLNEPSWLRFVGDKGVRTLEDARRYIRDGPVASYERHGFGLYATERKDGGVPIGICGLLKRDSLAHADIGFAFLPAYWGKGYAFEAASAVMRHGKTLGVGPIVAVTAPDNAASIRVLEKLGLRFSRLVRLSEHDTESSLFEEDDSAPDPP
jgi:RimJ/RimL family protein N-acetyltransferase